MRRVLSLYATSVGKKVAMAVSGVILLLFVVVHMLGNLKLFEGAATYDAYAGWLREVGAPVLGRTQALWGVRLVLLACLALHVVAAAQLWVRSARARRAGYAAFEDQSFHFASRTMRWGGIAIVAFVVVHVLHLTTGTLHPDFRPSVHANVVNGFRSWPVAVFYVLAMVPLALHVYHGVWSTTQTLGLSNPRLLHWRRAFAAALAWVLLAGYVALPLAVVLGWVR
jgi:succinate dehydrogenase / fumarate reductase cytochrome b subunit